MRITLTIFFLSFIAELSGQVYFSIIPKDEQSIEYFKKAETNFMLSDSTQSTNRLNQVLKSLRKDGYLTPTFSELWQSDTLKLAINIGQNFDVAFINPGNADIFVLGEIGYQTNDFDDFWSLRRTQVLLNQLLEFYEDNGYPFSRVKLNLLSEDDDTLKTSLEIFTGPYKSLDSVVVKSDTKIPEGYISYHLGLKKENHTTSLNLRKHKN